MHVYERLYGSRPSFLGGLASIIYCRALSARPFKGAADATAIRSDWLEIGRDMLEAIAAYERSP